MVEQNGNAKMQVIIGWATLGLLLFSALAGMFIVPLQDKIQSVKEEIKEFKADYKIYHVELDNRLQREMRDVNDKTVQQLKDLDDKLQKEITLNIKIMEAEIEK